MKTLNVSMAAFGNTPVILTVPHDGGLIGWEHKIFKIVREERTNDEGTVYLVMAIRRYMEEEHSKRPYTLFQEIERRRLDKHFVEKFYRRVLRDVIVCLGQWGRCYLFDIHGFADQLPGEDYDIIFGTDNRRTIIGNFDEKFAAFLGSLVLSASGDRKLRAFLPQQEPVPEQRFGATKNHTLVKWIKNREPRVSAMQVEVYRNWLMSDERTEVFARTFANAITVACI